MNKTDRYYINCMDINHMSLPELRKSLTRTQKSLELLRKVFPLDSDNLYIKKKRQHEKKMLLDFLQVNGDRYYDLKKVQQKMLEDEAFEKQLHEALYADL